MNILTSILLIIIILILSFFLNINFKKKEENKFKENLQTIMVINLLRHGARNPNKFIKEVEEYFINNIPGKLTLNGFQQMKNLGRSVRKIYIENHFKNESLNNFLNITNINKEFLLISSPVDRAIESGISYSNGFLPNNDFNLIDLTNNDINYESKSVLNKKHKSLLKEEDKHSNKFNFLIENKNRDVIFHSKRCIFPEEIYSQSKDNNDRSDSKNKNKSKSDINYNYLNLTEKEEIFYFLKSQFKKTFENFHIENFTDKYARSLFSIIRCTNENSKNKKLNFPKKIENSLIRLFGKFLYLEKSKTEEIDKITVSPFFDHIKNFFDFKIKKINDEINGKKKEKNFCNFWKLENYQYNEEIKMVTYSGHDYNFIGIFKNLLQTERLKFYLENSEKYEKFILFPFASSLDFHLVKDFKSGKYYVKIFLNWEEVFEYIRTGEFEVNENGEFIEKEIIYEKGVGIEYEVFIKIINNRIFEKYHECIHTNKIKKNKELKNK
jgi:hypothetical protein